MKKIKNAFLSISIILYLKISPAIAVDHVVNLIVDYKTVNYTGKKSTAIAINNQVPAPTLHFKEGDHVTINVYNHLNEDTAIHWHGVLLPWQMDGVLGVSQKGIKPGCRFQYKFTLRQSGTYWYHAHAGLQEQQGLYGAFIIDPIKPTSYSYTKDYVVVLSDWSNTNPDKILANLKKDGDYYSPRFPLQPSLCKFINDYKKDSVVEKHRLLQDYMTMQKMRMSIYDISDVAYDAFLLNGRSKSNPWQACVRVGDVVRLRFIGAGAGTIFHVKIPNATMQMVHAQGNNIEPYVINDFKIAPGETYDVLVKIEKDCPYIIYAESMDTVGAAYGALVTSRDQLVNYKSATPFPEPLPVTREMMSMMMDDMNHTHMDHAMPMTRSMTMPTEPTIIGDKMQPPTSDYKTSIGTKYQSLTGAVKTNDPNKPVYKVINMQLFGYMDRFIWFINGVPEYKAKPIVIEQGKRYRIVFTNTSMMHHPMHIHGHWFILREGKGAYDPLLHTIDVPPGATMTVDIDADASGQWFFHCHFLYHMISGMSRVFQYSTLIELVNCETKPQDIVKQTGYHNRPIIRIDKVRLIDESLVKHPMAHPAGLWLATFLDVGEDPFNNVQRLTYKGLYGSDYNKLELFANDAEIYKGKTEDADIDIFYWRLISQFWAVKGGINYTYRPAGTPYWQPGIGIEGLMPYFIDTDIRGYYYDGSTKLDIGLSRDTQITNNFFIRLGISSILATKSVSRAEIGSGVNEISYVFRPYYRLMPGLSVYAQYEHDQDYGPFKKYESDDGSPTMQNTITFGVSVLF